MKMVNGVAVMVAPEELEVETTEEETGTVVTTETTIEKREGVISVTAEEKLEEETQHVYDVNSEEQSRTLAAKVREENDERAKKAAIETTPKKIGNVIVAHSNSYDDIDIFAAELEKKEDSEN